MRTSSLAHPHCMSGAVRSRLIHRWSQFFLSHAGRTNLAILIELGVGFQEVRVEQRLRVGDVGKADEHEPSSDNVRRQPPFEGGVFGGIDTERNSEIP
jgi:hypothetical protein